MVARPAVPYPVPYPSPAPSAATRTASRADPADAFDAALSRGPGYAVLRGLVPGDLVEGALRRLNVEIARRGLTPEQITEWTRGTYFPHLRWEPEVLALREPVERLFHPRPGERWGDAQLLLRFPDEAAEWPLAPHVDTLPEWAGTSTYRAIAGVALTASAAGRGCLTVWPGSHAGTPGDPVPVELNPGDVVVMHPSLGHTGTLNHGGSVRYAVYFRLLTAPA